MSLKIKPLAQGPLGGSQETPANVYPPDNEELENSALVKNIMLCNTSAAEVTVNLYLLTVEPQKLHLIPKNMKLSPGAVFVDAHEIVLEPGDRVQSDRSGSSEVVDYILNGFERIP